MQQQARSSSCARAVHSTVERSSAYSYNPTKRHSGPPGYSPAPSSARSLTPPPTKGTTAPRRSLEKSVAVSTSSDYRASMPSEALADAFTTEGSSGLLPSNLYRLPFRPAPSSPRSNPSDASSVTSTPAMSVTSEQSRPSRPSTPETAYAPMAAGFARLARKNDVGGLQQARRVVKDPKRPSLELEARMFSGPA